MANRPGSFVGKWLGAAAVLLLFASSWAIGQEPAPTTPPATTPAATAPAAAPEPAPVTAADVDKKLSDLIVTLDIMWLCLAAFLVFFMQAGFALVECGLTRAKNTVNIMMKNFLDFSFGSVAYWVVGFAMAYGLGVRAGGGPVLVWLGLTVGLTVSAVLLVARYLYVSRRASRLSLVARLSSR